MATIPAAGYVSNAARTTTEMKQALEDVVASLRQVPGAGQPELSLTITSGSITPPGSGGVLVIDTEAAAATDDLTNIVTTNYPDGSCLLVRNNNSARLVVLKHAAGGAGQMQLDRAADYVLDDTKKWLLLQRRGADWYEVLRGPTRVAMPSVAKSATFTVQKEDLGKVFLCSGTFTVTLLAVSAAASGAGNGFVVTIRNVSTGTVTLDANASELIDGATTLAVLPGWSYELVCDGAAWTSTGFSGPGQPQENPVINGNMEVWQRGTSFAVNAVDVPTADRWRYAASFVTSTMTIARSTNVPTVAQAGVLFNYSLECDVTAADTSIAAADYAAIAHVIEGGVWRHFAQRVVTVSFWVLSTKTGTHCVALSNTAGDRSYVAPYTVIASNTWEYKTVTIAASPNAGTWDYGTGRGVTLWWTLAAGSNLQTTAGAWQTAVGGLLATSAQVNVLDSTANFFRLTGVQLELGSVATPIGISSFADDLHRCQRYFQKTYQQSVAPGTLTGTSSAFGFQSVLGASAALGVSVVFPVVMRASPVMTFYNPAVANNFSRNVSDAVDDATTGASSHESGFVLSVTANAGNTVGDFHYVHWTADAELS
jgi:X-X-X-Leu-X-X-Gly heptad repeat protein